MTRAKEITVTVTFRLCPVERRALGYQNLRVMYAVPPAQAADEATAITRSAAQKWALERLNHAVDLATERYLEQCARNREASQ